MDLINIFLLILISIIVGIILTVLVQYYVLINYFNKGPVAKTSKKLDREIFILPETLKKKLEDNENSGLSLPISLLLQFLFHELRHSNNIKQWLYKKLSMEFDELLTKTTIGKFFEAVNIRDMHLGSQFPDIHDISLDSIDLDQSDGYINTLNLSIKLDYTGNFLLAVDAKMKFGKTAYLSIKVKRINGLARLQFTRIPYTHWSFSFYTDPLIDLAVESHFQGRQLQSNVTNLIVNQIKKAIKRKHTLPNYKIRYKPFFVKTDPGQLDHTDGNEIVPQGQLEVTCMDVSRLALLPDVSSVYCTFAVDNTPFVSLQQRDNVFYLVLEFSLMKNQQQQQLGVIFKQETSETVAIDSVAPQTPAADSGLKAGDVILSIENRCVTNVSQIGKIIKSTPTVTVSFKIERRSSDYTLRGKSEDKPPSTLVNSDEDPLIDEPFIVAEKNNDAERKVPKRYERVPRIISSSNENMVRIAHTIGNFTLRKRRTSTCYEKTSESAGSNKSTPNPSCPSTPQKPAGNTVSLTPNCLSTKKHSIPELPEIIRTDTESEVTESLNLVPVYRGKSVGVKPLMNFNDDFLFDLNESAKYLNVNVWGQIGSKEDDDVLLGYTNIPLNDILNAICNSSLGQYTRSYSFLPPNNTPGVIPTHPLMSHSGFEHVFCFGDVLLSFAWNNESIEVKSKTNSGISIDANKIPTKMNENQHDFVRTQFHRSIHCDFCSKKIWLKDAVQCRNCGMCCHKKCVSKCKSNSECHSSKLDMDQSELDIVDPLDDELLGGSIKRVNSVNNLSIPGAHISPSQSRSLPPSPQRTPARKQSISSLANPFSLCPTALEDIQHQSADASHETIMRLLDLMLLSATDENLMENARESGRHLYASMGPEEKLEKINAMMGELKRMFDFITNEHTELSTRMSCEDGEVEKAKLAFQMGQADAKIQGLSVLMLHFCSGLQQ